MSELDNVWTRKYRPLSIEELILSDSNQEYFSKLTKIPNNLLFMGRPGAGKTALAKLLAQKFCPNSYLYINASDENGIETVRTKITEFVSTISIDGNDKLVILDEACGLSNSAQTALRGVMEEYLEDVRFILTGNNKHKIIEALESRCIGFDFSLDIRKVGQRILHILKSESIKISDDQKKNLPVLIRRFYPDLRKTINELQKCCIGGEFIYVENVDSTMASQIYTKMKTGVDLFEIREMVIIGESSFANDYYSLMRSLFDEYLADKNVSALLLIADYMYRSLSGGDQEVNFTALLFNIRKLG